MIIFLSDCSTGQYALSVTDELEKEGIVYVQKPRIPLPSVFQYRVIEDF